MGYLHPTGQARDIAVSAVSIMHWTIGLAKPPFIRFRLAQEDIFSPAESFRLPIIALPIRGVEEVERRPY